jgi:radical SAM superfamily enzyme YgiQ (UPF0313 family)
MKKIFLMTISLKSFPMVPYATGCLISYCLKDKCVNENYVFLDPEYRYNCESFDDFHEKLASADIIGLTCYVWNQTTNDRISKQFKDINPDGIVIYGGPNVPEDKEDANEYIVDRPFVDLFFVGPGEKNFLNFLKNYHVSNKLTTYDGCYNRFNDNVKIQKSDYNIAQMPTPYLDGIFDSILTNETRIFVPIESNRGCPYGCSFCDWGSLTRSKVFQFDFDLVKQNISKIMQYKSVAGIDIIDANFGMFARDVELVDHIYNQKIKNNKKLELLLSGTAKNGSKFLTDIFKKLEYFDVDNFSTDVKNIKVSFQSFSNQALAAVDRKNMTFERLTSVVTSTTSNSISSELIIGLPGETVDSWIDTISKHKELNLDFGRVYHLNVLPNTPMYKKDYRINYKTNYTKVYIPVDLINIDFEEAVKKYKNLENVKTNYDFNNENKLNFETFEIMRSSFSFTTEQLKEMYLYNFWFNTFWNTNLLKEEIKNNNLPIKEQIMLFYKLVNSHESVFLKKIVNDYKSLLNLVFVESDINVLTDLKSVIFLHKNMGRGTELLEIIDNLSIFEKEIKIIYPTFCSSKVFKFENIQHKKKLLSAYTIMR